MLFRVNKTQLQREKFYRGKMMRNIKYQFNNLNKCRFICKNLTDFLTENIAFIIFNRLSVYFATFSSAINYR